MIIKEPTATYIPQEDKYEHIAFCASTCYNSTPKKGEVAEKFVQGLIKSKHVSVLRHASYYFICPNDPDVYAWIDHYTTNPYIDVFLKDGEWYMATNGQFILEHDGFYRAVQKYEVTPEVFNSTPIGHYMMRYTFVLETQISTSRELARHSPQNFTEASTRYIKGQEAIVRPHWLELSESDDEEELLASNGTYVLSCINSFDSYSKLLSEGMKPEDARGVLPLDTYTKVIMTHSIKEWQKIIDMRVNGSTGRPHPNIKYLISMVRDELIKLGCDMN